MRRSCPSCRDPIRSSEFASINVPPPREDADAVSSNSIPDTGVEAGGALSHDEMVALRNMPGSKINRLLQLIQAMPTDEKGIVFSYFPDFIKMIAEALRGTDIKFVQLLGSMTPKQRQRSLETFENDSSTRIFLLSLKAAGFGITLTAANHCFLMEPSGNHALEQQAIARVSRMGQTKVVKVVSFFTRGTVEELMYRELYDEQSANRNQSKVDLLVKFFAPVVSAEEARSLS